MRIKQLCYFFIINSFIVLGQKNEIALKVFLEDAYTGKNVKDAKVTLEGFEIPEIVGKYDKKGKFYYFMEIPEGYNTIMAYHKKYNEKGFQNKIRLPKVITLNLYDPLNVSNEIHKKEDSIYSYDLAKIISSKYTRYVYVEDPYKIVLFLAKLEDCFKLEKTIKENNINIELINPLNKDVKEYNSTNQKITCDCFLNKDFVFYDYFQSDQYNSRGYKEGNVFSVILRKKDGTKFKRFNDPIIKKLRDYSFSVNSIIYNKFYYDGNRPYKPKYTKYLDKFNYTIEEENKSKFFLYNNHGNNKKVFEVVSIDTYSSIIDDKKNISLIEYDELGLGIIDQYEYLDKETILK